MAPKVTLCCLVLLFALQVHTKPSQNIEEHFNSLLKQLRQIIHDAETKSSKKLDETYRQAVTILVMEQQTQTGVLEGLLKSNQDEVKKSEGKPGVSQACLDSISEQLDEAAKSSKDALGECFSKTLEVSLKRVSGAKESFQKFYTAVVDLQKEFAACDSNVCGIYVAGKILQESLEVEDRILGIQDGTIDGLNKDLPECKTCLLMQVQDYQTKSKEILGDLKRCSETSP